MRIFTLVSHYLPGYKAGGPVRTIASVVEQLGESFDFWILTGDRDHTDIEPYPNVPLHQWVTVGKAQVHYVDLSSLSLHKLSSMVGDLKPDIVYVNSLLSAMSNKYLLARRLSLIPRVPTIVAPRGVFSPGAMRLKRRKKQLYLRAVQSSGLFNGLIWQASSPLEKESILTTVSGVRDRDVLVAPDIVISDSKYSDNGNSLTKDPGYIRFIFLSRITGMKNLEFALTLLRDVDGFVEFDVYGPIDDPSYWNVCEQAIASLPDNITVRVHDAVSHEEVGKVLGSRHFLLLPTLGENFGHVIVEALQVGCPVIVSDRTPWNDLSDAGAGWGVPLEDNEKWIEILQYCIDMGQDDFANHSKKAKQYAMSWLSSSNALQANKNMFLHTAAMLDH